jgi:hypothetical protein
MRKYAQDSANDVVLVDLADIESNGIKSLDSSGNVTNEVMKSEYLLANDPWLGHLNETGTQRMARAMWWLMARLRGWMADSTPTPSPNCLSLADLNCDNQVDYTDFFLVSKSYLLTPDNPKFDTNSDGKVNILDLVRILKSYVL